MSPALIQPNASINSLRAIQMENEWLALSILPDVGAKLYDLIWKPTGRNVLWHNPRVLPQTFAIEANFDNYWCGGWDEGFPTCDACEYKGEMYPNLGELRSVRWNVVSTERDGTDMVARLAAFGPISPVHAEKTVTLSGSSPVVKMQYEVTNLGPVLTSSGARTRPSRPRRIWSCESRRAWASSASRRIRALARPGSATPGQTSKRLRE